MHSESTFLLEFNVVVISLLVSENNEFNIEDIPDYKMPSADKVLEDDVEFRPGSDDLDNSL